MMSPTGLMLVISALVFPALGQQMTTTILPHAVSATTCVFPFLGSGGSAGLVQYSGLRIPEPGSVFQPGEHLKFKCLDPNFDIVGNWHILCIGPKWSNPVPTCRPHEACLQYDRFFYFNFELIKISIGA